MIQPLGEKVVIPFSKAKLAAFTLLLLALVAAFAYLIVHPDGFRRHSPGFVQTVGIIGALVFGVLSLLAIARLFDRRPGLVVDRQGLIDRTTHLGVGRINWTEVRDLRIVKMRMNKFLVIDVHDPDRFLDRGNVLQRLLRAGNLRAQGSPIALSSNLLEIGFDRMTHVVRCFFDQAKDNGKPPLCSNGGGV
jgi:hypothetical protein